jgi:glutamate synthase (NADPH/NADH) large chain
MSGGIAYVYDRAGTFPSLVNYEMVQLEPLDEEERAWLRTTIDRHQGLTGSTVAARILGAWSAEVERFYKVMPQDYRRVLRVLQDAEKEQLSEDATLAKVMEAAHG